MQLVLLSVGVRRLHVLEQLSRLMTSHLRAFQVSSPHFLNIRQARVILLQILDIFFLILHCSLNANSFIFFSIRMELPKQTQSNETF